MLDVLLYFDPINAIDTGLNKILYNIYLLIVYNSNTEQCQQS